MNYLQREQLREALLRLLLNHFLVCLVEQKPDLADYLHKQISEFQELVADDVRHNPQIVSLALSQPSSASFDIDEVLAELNGVSKWLDELLAALLAQPHISLK